MNEHLGDPTSSALPSHLVPLHELASALLAAESPDEVDVMVRHLARSIIGAADARLVRGSVAHHALESVPAPVDDGLVWIPIRCEGSRHDVLMVGFASPPTFAPAKIELLRLEATMAVHSLDRLAAIEEERGQRQRSEVLQHLASGCAGSRVPADVSRALIDVLIGAGMAVVEVSVAGHHARATGRQGAGTHRAGPIDVLDLHLHAEVDEGREHGSEHDEIGRLRVTVPGGSALDPRHDSFWRAVVRVTGYALARVRRFAELEDLARSDPLTGLPNRRVFDEHLRRGLARRQRADDLLAVIYIDLDRFKEVNDRFGHQLGDEVLVRVGATLRDAVRPADLAARLGGDEFAVLAESVPSEEIAQELAERIRTSIARRVGAIIGQTVTASVGYAVTRCAEDADEFLTRADRAMYAEKRFASIRDHPEVRRIS